MGIPKGGADQRELPDENALREFREETGLTLTPESMKFIGVWVISQTFYDGVDIKAIAYFHVKEPVRLEGGQKDNVAWLDRHKLTDAKFVYDHIPEVLRRCGVL